MQGQPSVVGWGFWLKWAITTSVGLIMGLGLFLFVGPIIERVVGVGLDSLSPGVFGLVMGSIFGLALGVAQWWILVYHVKSATAWLWATPLGFMVGAVVIFGLLNGSETDTSLVIKLSHGVVLGLTLGIAQWFAVRTQVNKAVYWIGLSLLGWVIAAMLGMTLSAMLGLPLDWLGLLLGGGVLPGVGMLWLLNQTTTPEVTSPTGAASARAA